MITVGSLYRSNITQPEEKTLALEFGCSRMTMKRALDTLAAEGMLFRKRGHGTFIIQSAMQDEHVHVVSNEIPGLSNLLKGKDVKSKVIRFEVQFPPQDAAAHLAIDEKTPVYNVVRLRIVEGSPALTTRCSTIPLTTISRESCSSKLQAHTEKSELASRMISISNISAAGRMTRYWKSSMQVFWITAHPLNIHFPATAMTSLS